MIITRDIISFAFVGEDHQIDHIPLSEIDFVIEMKDQESQAGLEATVAHDQYKLQIGTVENGYNSGRVYRIATRDREELKTLIARLTKFAKAARKRAEARTLFRKIQLKVLKRYETRHVQALMALMIMAVIYVCMYVCMYYVYMQAIIIIAV